eukprot:COSAG02_NODE_5531_length_4252_cov_2.279316_5_plen_294_part_00
MLGIVARAAHSSDPSTSVSTYRRVFSNYCTFNAPFAVTSSCVTMASCNFDGDHIYQSGRTTYSPSDICSSSSSRRRSSSSYSSSSSTYGSSSSPHVSFVGIKWFFYIFILLPCYIICKCCGTKDDPPAAQTVHTSVSRVSILCCYRTTSAHGRYTELPPLPQSINVTQTTNTVQAAQPTFPVSAPTTPQVMAAPQAMVAPHAMAAPLQPVQQLSSAQPTPHVQQTSNPLSTKTLGEFLNELNLSQFETELRSLGVTAPADLVDLEAADCEACGMKKLEVKRLMRCVGADVVAL